jgi:hypothetical protein
MRRFAGAPAAREHGVLLALTTLLIAGAALGAGAPFAALTVTPAGAQSYNLTTGVTTLADGGTVVDGDTGVKLHAATITYVDGVYIDAKGASVVGSFGTLKADVVHIDIKAGVMTASGTLSLKRDALSVTAAAVRYDANDEVVDFKGPVTGTAPDFRADRVLLDALSGDVLLLGNYRFSEGPLVLEAPKGGGRLELVFHRVHGAPVYDASTQVAPPLLARFSTELR